jgi:glucuronoarabinoxylan endo-1,4-beta-xylanase
MPAPPVRPSLIALVAAGAIGAAAGAACIIHPVPPAPPSQKMSAAASLPPYAAVVTLKPSERHQTLVGFGASVAWFQDKLVPTPPDGAYQLLFPDLGLDILRLRNRHGRVVKREDGNVAQDVEIYRRATAALGHPPKVLLSSWSPPATLKANRAEDCHGNADCTLAKESGRFVYEKFAAWWRESVGSYQAQGLSPDWISIENEPSFIPPTWEGCRFDPTETAQYPGYDRALVAVHDALATLPRPPAMLGPEVLGIHWGLLEKYVRPMNLDLVAGIAHHIYEKGPDNVWDYLDPGPDSFIDEMQAAAKLAGSKPLFQTEFGTEGDDRTLGGFETALLMHHSLVEEGVVAFLWWDLYWVHGGGLVDIDRRPLVPRDQYYSVRHYARFTDPGDVRVGATSDAPDKIRASAFRSAASDRLTAIIINSGDQTADVRIDAGGPGPAGGAASAIYRTVYRPSASAERWQELGALPASGIVQLPGRSIATVVWSSGKHP